MGHIASEGELECDAATDPVGQWLSPAGFLRGQVENSLGAGRLAEERAPISDWVLFCCRRQFVDKALGDEHVVRRPDAAPEGRRNARRLHPRILHMQVRDAIDEVDSALGGVGV
jgi:hypothetical protein